MFFPKFHISIRPALANLGAGLVFVSGCSDGSFSGSTGVKRPKVEQADSSGSLDGLPQQAVPTPTPNLPGYDVLEAGTVTSKVGINMDDRGGNVDYNDTAYCFSFRGAIRGKQIVSGANQVVQVNRTNRSGCSHEMEIRILDAGRNLRQSLPDLSSSNQDYSFTMNVQRGDFIEVVARAFVCRGNISRADRLMTDPTYFQIAPNVCNNTGN